jgi:hypothetical protein
MTPEETFKHDIRGVLHKIKTLSLYISPNEAIRYQIDYDGSVSAHNNGKKEIMLLKKLTELGGIVGLEKEYPDDDYLIRFEAFEIKLDLPKFEEIYNNYNDIPKTDSKTFIEYNPVTGIGSVNGVPFKFKANKAEYRIFEKLYANIGNRLDRYDVLVWGHFYEDGDRQDDSRKTQETSFINKLVVNMRKKTGLNKEQIVNNSGNLTLIGTKKEQK